MSTTLTSKGQVTIPKHIRDALNLGPGSAIDFAVNAAGELVLRQPAKAVRTSKRKSPPKDRFDAVRGSADVRSRTDDLMKLLRSDE
jgi:AbrB family looped-hinge helix DNA binding protein